MKKLIAIFVVAALSFAAATTADAGRFGIKGGVNVTSLDLQSGSTPGALGYSAGLTWQWNLPLWFALQPEVMYKVSATTLQEAQAQLSTGSLEIPLNIQWGPRIADKNIRVFAQATPFIGYNLHQEAESINISTGNSALDGVINGAVQDKYGDLLNSLSNLKKFTYGAGLGVGVQFFALQVTAQYVWNFGTLTEDAKLSEEMFNDSNFGGYNVTLALMFGGKKKNKK